MTIWFKWVLFLDLYGFRRTVDVFMLFGIVVLTCSLDMGVTLDTVDDDFLKHFEHIVMSSDVVNIRQTMPLFHNIE